MLVRIVILPVSQEVIAEEEDQASKHKEQSCPIGAIRDGPPREKEEESSHGQQYQDSSIKVQHIPNRVSPAQIAVERANAEEREHHQQQPDNYVQGVCLQHVLHRNFVLCEVFSDVHHGSDIEDVPDQETQGSQSEADEVITPQQEHIAHRSEQQSNDYRRDMPVNISKGYKLDNQDPYGNCLDVLEKVVHMVCVAHQIKGTEDNEECIEDDVGCRREEWLLIWRIHLFL